MRSKKELYEIALNKFRNTDTPFLCNVIENIFVIYKLISEEERDLLIIDLHDNYPSKTQHSEFMIKGRFNHDNKHGSWWRHVNSKISRNIRISFLEKMVRINS